MPRTDRIKWTYVALPDSFVQAIDECVESSKYPLGMWHSRVDVVIAALKEYPALKPFLDKHLESQKKS